MDFLNSFLRIDYVEYAFAFMLLVISSAARIALNYYVTFTSEEWRRIISTNLMRTLGGSNVDDYKNAGKELITKVIITDTDNIMNYRIRPFLMIIAYGTTASLIFLFYYCKVSV